MGGMGGKMYMKYVTLTATGTERLKCVKKLTRLHRALAKLMNAEDDEFARSLWYVLLKVMTIKITTSEIEGRNQLIIIILMNNSSDDY